MTQKEKAVAYDELLKRAQDLGCPTIGHALDKVQS